MTDDERIAEIEAREAKATKGPWVTYDNGFDGGVVAGLQEAVTPIEGKAFYEHPRGKIICGGEPCEGFMDPDEPDTQFIAHSRSDIPFLLSRLSQARAVISAARKCEQCCASDQPDHDGPDNLKAALAAYDKGGEGE